MPEIEIRPATSTDIDHVQNIVHSYHTTHVWQMEHIYEDGQITISFREVRLPRSVGVKYPHMIKELDKDWMRRSTVLIATIKDTPVGYIRLSEHLAPDSAWTTDLAVKKEMRRKGIASALIFAGQDWATGKGLKRIILEMQSKNHPAIQMAFKLGFEFCGYNDHYFENQDIFTS